MVQKKSYRSILVEDIENGMIIGKDILGPGGEILLAEGFKVTAAVVIRRLLNQHGIALAYILKEAQSSVPESTDVNDETRTISNIADNEKLIKIINEFSDDRENMKESFDKLIKGEKMEKQEIEDKINDILGIFDENANIFQVMQNVKHLDNVTYSHCYNVALISYKIGCWIDLEDKDLEELVLSGMLMDIGKMRIDEKLLNKKGILTDDEFEDLKRHSVLGHEIIKDYDFISERVKRAVLLHHERIDGSGYPFGLKGDDIPLFARIIAIADVYNALVSDRSYRSKRTPFEAIKILETEYMNKLDINILYLFLCRIASNYIGQRILLNNDERGEIVFIPELNIYRPVIKLQDSGKIVDLGDSRYAHLDIVEFF
ncbi:MAG TPA: HD-GYP domain-containing protein [Oscillospiraceae bacterium]|nr:HD-GYP domain-containing protein [Oscillospiraceae bacterium]